MFRHKFILPIIPISINHFQKQNNYFFFNHKLYHNLLILPLQQFHNWDHANLII